MNVAGAHDQGSTEPTREVLWFDLPAGGAACEMAWSARVPGTRASRLSDRSATAPVDPARPLTSYVRRHVVGWPGAGGAATAWVASVGVYSALTAHAGRTRRAHPGVHHLVIAWEDSRRIEVSPLGARAEAGRSARAADLVICADESMRARLLDADFDPERVRVVCPGVDTELFAPSAPTGDPVVAFADPLTRTQGIEMLLAAWELVREQVPRARLRVLGDGPLAPLVQLAAARGLGVAHVGAPDAAALATEFASAGVYAAAPQHGVVRTAASRLRLLQAQSSGLPVVSTRAGGDQPFVADPPNDLVTQDPAHLAERLVWWLTHPGHAAQVGAHNRRRMLRDHGEAEQIALLGQALRRAETSSAERAASLQDQRPRDELAAQR